jgi:hypothetical protein
MKRISPGLSKQYGRTVLQGGEVLVNVRGTLGGVAVATPGMKGWNVSREVAVVPVDTDKADSDYIAYWIGSSTSQLWLRGVQKGVAYTGINLADLRKLPVDLPSLEKQREIVLHIRAAHSRAAGLANEVERAQALLERLGQAALAKAFRGELGLNGPNDESSVASLTPVSSPIPSTSDQDSIARRRKLRMSELTSESVVEAIRTLPHRTFTFDDLRAHFPGDYERLRDIVFDLLGQPQPHIVQQFDPQVKSMCFRKVS